MSDQPQHTDALDDDDTPHHRDGEREGVRHGIGAALRGRRVLVGALAVLGVAGALAVYGFRAPPRSAGALEARLELAAGNVKIDGKNAFSGAALENGAHIEASDGARALLRLSDGAAVFLRGGSDVSLTGAAVSLQKGEVWLDAPPEERRGGGSGVHKIGDGVEVSASDAGLSLSTTDKGGAVVYVARGLAVVTSKGGRVEVHAGEQALVADAAAAPAVKPVAFWSDWTGGLGDHAAASAMSGAGSGTLYGVDLGAPAGTAARPLEIAKQVVHAAVRAGFAETSVDQTFANPGDRDVEGWYWFTLPEGASVTGFELETDGRLVDGELIERRDAAAQYGRAVATGHDPALLEWIDGRTYRARIFPVPRGGTRRVVVRYLEMLPLVGGRLRYVYPMQSRAPVRIGEFALTVDLGDAGTGMQLTTLADARVEDGGKRVTMRRSGYTPRADFQLEGVPQKKTPPVTVSRFVAGGDAADYVMLRYLPDVDWVNAPQAPADVVVVVDTSAAGDDASRQLKAATAEAIMRALSASDNFALVSLDVKPTVLHPAEGMAPAKDEEIATALERLAEHAAGGATDMSALFDTALARVHGAEQPAIVYVGDGIPTSGETSGEALTERLRRALSTSRARLFTVGVGADANVALLGELARAGGGQSFNVEAADQTTERALRLVSALKAPTITDLDLDVGAGLDEVFVTQNGKVSRGDEVILLARTHNDLPVTLKVKGRLGGKDFTREHEIVKTTDVGAAMVPRLWAAELIRRTLGGAVDPDAVRGKVTSLGIEYGLMTPYTSFLALESEEAYAQQGIQRRNNPLRGVHLAALGESHTEESVALAAAGFFVGATGLACSSRDAEPALAADALVPSSAKVAAAPPPPPPPSTQAFELSVRQEGAPAGAAPMNAAPRAPDLDGAAAVGLKTAGYAQNDVGLTKDKAVASNAVERKTAPLRAAKADAIARAKEKAREMTDARAQVATAKKAEPTSTSGSLAARNAKRAPAPQPLPPLEVEREHRRIVTVVSRACSDVAERPLPERAVIWRQRMKAARTPDDLVARYEGAKGACELPDWRAESLFLRLLEPRVDDEGTATAVLSSFDTVPESQRYLARLILRRANDERVVAAVSLALFGAAVDWRLVDLDLQRIASADARLERLRAAVAKAPDDPEGTLRLVKLLAETGKKDEALQQARRLADLGLMTPSMARTLGDVLADQGNVDEAVRAYSEIVEFDPDSAGARRALGDIYLAHGWYGPAYRQFRALDVHADPLASLRLAMAAAGDGRVDEALRIERAVAESEGTPGPADPRRFARLWSATRLAHLLRAPPADADAAGASGDDLKESVTRKLKELQLFRGNGRYVVVTWEDLDADVVLDSAAVGEATDASAVGLSAVLLPGGADATRLTAHLRTPARAHALKLVRHEITSDGKTFTVQETPLELAAGETAIAL